MFSARFIIPALPPPTADVQTGLIADNALRPGLVEGKDILPPAILPVAPHSLLRGFITFRAEGIANARQLMSVRVTKISHVKIRAIRLSDAGLSFIRSAIAQTCRMEFSHIFRAAGFEGKHRAVPGRCRFLVKRRTDAKTEALT